MEEISLDKYKSAWKAEQSFGEEKLSREQIEAYMHSASRSIAGLFRKSLVIDIVIKSLLAVSFGGLLVLFLLQGTPVPAAVVLILLSIILIVLQIRTYRRVPGAEDASQNTRSLLNSYVGFYYRSFVSSLIAGAVSGPLVLISGSLYYFYFKYGTIRPLQTDDLVVFGSFILIGFLLNAIVQFKNFSFHIGQLKDSLAEIEQDTLSESRLNYYKKSKYRNLIIYSIILLVGLLLFLLLLLQAG